MGNEIRYANENGLDALLAVVSCNDVNIVFE